MDVLKSIFELRKYKTSFSIFIVKASIKCFSVNFLVISGFFVKQEEDSAYDAPKDWAKQILPSESADVSAFIALASLEHNVHAGEGGVVSDGSKLGIQ